MEISPGTERVDVLQAAIRSREYCADLQAGGAVDRDAGEVRGRGERALDESGCGAGSRSARYRLGGDHASRRMEVDADATAVCREDQRSEVGDGEGGGGRAGRMGSLKRGRNAVARFKTILAGSP
jgi:hypothetical protein